MTITEIVERINLKYLRKLPGGEEAGKEAFRDIPIKGVEDRAVRIPGKEHLRIPPQPFHLCACGKTTRDFPLARQIILNDGHKAGHAAVLAVADRTHSEDNELPIVLAVGINYGQGSDYLKEPTLMSDDTDLIDNVKRVLEVVGRNCDKFDPPKQFNLVATNFFPWITNDSWGEAIANSIEEAIGVFCLGFDDPYAHVVELASELSAFSEPLYIIFHGANNCVPAMGIETVRRLRKEKLHTSFEFIFSDNLAPPTKDPDNAVRLIPKKPRRKEVREVADS